MKKMSLMLLMVALVGLMSTLSFASVYTVGANTIVSVPRQSDGWPRPEEIGDRIGVGDVGWMTTGGASIGYEQFDIPTLAENEVITSVLLNVQVVSQYNTTYNSGVEFGYVADDTWSTWGWGSPTGDWWNGGDWQNNPVVTDNTLERSGSDTGGTPYGWMQTEIIDFLRKTGEGPGEALSLAFIANGTGARGCYLGNSGDVFSNPYLTIETEIVPEPATLGLLVVGLVGLLRRKR